VLGDHRIGDLQRSQQRHREVDRDGQNHSEHPDNGDATTAIHLSSREWHGIDRKG